MIDESFWKNRRVLLTGHTGFKGSWLALWLSKLGAELHGLSLAPESVEPPAQPLFEALRLAHQLGSRHHLADIRSPSDVTAVVKSADPEVVIHFAAQSLIRRSYSDPMHTWSTNVQGCVNLLEALRNLNHRCAIVIVTTDKVYKNQEWDYGYRENDSLGGLDPYSASKAAAELAIASWRASFCGNNAHQTRQLFIATARAGNVIGGGDWAADRIIPDAIRALIAGNPIPLRNPTATRPWQHVLEPLDGYLRLAERLFAGDNRYTSTFNFGPTLQSTKTVSQLIEAVLVHWPGSWVDRSNPSDVHEAQRLHLQIDKAYHQLGWHPTWNFSTTIARTACWYKSVYQGSDPLECCLADLDAYQAEVLNVCQS